MASAVSLLDDNVDADGAGWDEFVTNNPSASLYHLRGWRRVIEKSFGHKTFYLMAHNGRNEVQGIFPLVFLSGPLFGRFLVSMPYFNYGGILSKTPEAQSALLSRGVALAREIGAEHIELRERKAHEWDLSVKSHKVAMVLDLPAEPGMIWDSFKSDVRRKVRRAGREGMVASFGGMNELDDFYRIFATNMRDLGTPVYPKAFFKNILSEFPDLAQICTVRLGPSAIASAFMIGQHDRMEMPWVSSLREFNRYYPNMFLYWSMIEHACVQGVQQFDLGRSSPGSGTYIFKEQWGAKAEPLYWYYWLREDSGLPNLTTTNLKFQTAIAVWRRMPLALANAIGPAIVKYLP